MPQTITEKRSPSNPILKIEDLKTYFHTEEGEIRAVDGVSLEMQRGSILALVGESGCGKSVTAYSVLQLIQKPGKIVGGRITLFPQHTPPIEITALNSRSDKLYAVRGGLVSLVFQEPMTALSPVHTIGNQLCEAILLHQHLTKSEAEKLAIKMLHRVGIPNAGLRVNQYPHELSGGMRQRVVIAIALVCQPELLIADEPTTALDVTIQAQVLGLIKSLREESGTSVLLITHDLGVVAQMADEVAVMYLGRIVEQAPVRTILKVPQHPYTMGLLASLPGRTHSRGKLPSIRGCVPSLSEIPPGCPFHPRCSYYIPGVCDCDVPPVLREISPGHRVACFGREQTR
jgi:oligopeptide/dipeptide ABC transporter ATP-binding protein